MTNSPTLSIIVPSYNEEKTLPSLIRQLDKQEGIGNVELILTDGGSQDKTLDTVPASWTVIHSPKGRGAQLNAGAENANGKILWFLHCDSRLPNGAIQTILNTVEDGAEFGCFHINFDQSTVLMQLNRYFSNRRAIKRGIAFGDQGIWMTRRIWNRLGGFPSLPLMEDYELCRQARRRQIPLFVLPAAITTSARRYGRHPLRTMMQMFWLRCLYRGGYPIERVAKIYGDIRS